MKNLLLIIILSYTLNSCAQDKSLNLVDNVLNTLKIERNDCLENLIIEQSISNSESIILIPEIAEKGDGFITLNGYILIVNNKNGKIKSSFSEMNTWASDAVILDNIEILYQPYKISNDYETVGVLIDYYNKSRVNPFSSKELSLFVRNGAKLERIFKDYSIYQRIGETNGMNSGEFVEHKKTIEPDFNSKTKFFNLKITDSINKTQWIDGDTKSIENSLEIENLKYVNGKYKNIL